jgi:signal transduction histidine kinase
MRSETTISEKEKTKPYRLVKYFTFTSLVVVFVGALVLSALFTHFMRTINRKKSEDYANLLVANLNHQVFMNFSIPVVWKFGGIQLHNEDQFKLMDTVVRNAVQGYHVEMARIYSPTNIISYSYETAEVGAKSVSSTNFKKAFAGQISYKLIQRGSFWEIFLGVPKEVKMVTMAPVRAENPTLSFVKGKGLVLVPDLVSDETKDVWEGEPLGVFEIVRDLTEDYRKIYEFQKLMFFSITGVMLVLFVTLRLVVKNGEKVLERRAQEQLELKERLNRAERLSALGELTAGVSHEIRNPLGIIQSSAELLRKKMAAYEPKNPVADIIVEESGRLNTIITDFLNFAVPKAPHLLPTSVEDVVEKNLVFLDPKIRESHIIVSRKFDSNLPQVMADQGLLYQAFLNILINAMQGMTGGGRIVVEITSRKKQVTVVFKDTGKGIPENVIGKVWDPFFTTKETGSGLGLGIVRNIIKSHDGDVSICNLPEGGAVVTVTLPVSERALNGNGTDR